MLKELSITALIESLPRSVSQAACSGNDQFLTGFNTETQFNTLVELSYFTVCWFMSDQLPHNCKYCHLSVVNQIDHIICQVICLHSRWTLFFCIVLPRELVRYVFLPGRKEEVKLSVLVRVKANPGDPIVARQKFFILKDEISKYVGK